MIKGIKISLRAKSSTLIED